MKFLSLIFPLFLSFQAYAVIYGEDNRKDIFNENNQVFIEISESVAGMVHRKDINPLLNLSARRFFKDEPSLKKMCMEEKFIEQRILPTCTGFLIAPDIILTASNCVNKSTDCQDYKWVFDFEMEDEQNLSNEFLRQKNVYSCSRIIDLPYENGLEYSLIELDRAVSDRTPLQLSSESIQSSEELVTIGHPSGLPLKISDNGHIKINQSEIFYVNLDSFKGNSGAPVIEKKSGKIVGMITTGKADFYFDSNADCFRSNQCNQEGYNCSVESRVEMEKVISSSALLDSISSQIRK